MRLSKNKIFFIIFISLITFSLFCVFTTSVSFAQNSFTADAYSTTAKSAIVIDKNTGKVLFEKNADEKLPIASTTKILTAITVIENIDDLFKTVSVPDCAIGVEGSSIYLEKGERLKVIDLLYGLMLQSGNDCAVALACLTSGSVENFARLMNIVAINAGATNSHFCNPHGLHEKNHYSTARDMSLISAYAMRNETFRKIVSTTNYVDCPYADRGYNRIIKNKNKILTTLDGGNGIKTGYTKVAGRCLVSSAQRKNVEIICVVLSCGPMFEESCDLINKAFAELGVNDE